MINLTDPIFHDENKAREHLEAIRWPDGATCPHCGSVENITRLAGAKHRPGLFQCNTCREHFTVTVGTVMERSHIPLPKWVLAFHLMASSKKGISAHQLHRMLDVTYKTAWFLAHRIREAMRDDTAEPMGGSGKIVEADETFIGTVKGRNVRRGHGHKRAVMSLVERGGKVRSFHIERANAENVTAILRTQVDRKSVLHTDEAKYYKTVGKEFTDHQSVNHSAEEYARPHVAFRDGKFTTETVHTNTLEGYYSVFKRGMIGVYQHCSEQHLKRYVAEFDFRYNNRAATGVDDGERAGKAIKGADGKRLTYRQPVIG